MENKDLAPVWDEIMAPYMSLKWCELSEKSQKVYQKFCDALAPKEPELVTDPSDLRVGDIISVVVVDSRGSSFTWYGRIQSIDVREYITSIVLEDEGTGGEDSIIVGTEDTVFLRHSKSIATRLTALPDNTHVSVKVTPDYHGEPLIEVEGYTATKTDPQMGTTSTVVITLQSVRGLNTIPLSIVLDFTILS